LSCVDLIRWEVTFPRAPEGGTQESSYDLNIEGSYLIVDCFSVRNMFVFILGQYDVGNQEQSGFIEAVIEPNEATMGRGEKVNLTCNVKGAQQYTVVWSEYAFDASLPDYVRVCINEDENIRNKIDFCLHLNSKKEIVSS
jgi:hypothetical protein